MRHALIVAAAFAAALYAAPALAQVSEKNSFDVKTSDLDLKTEAGVKTLTQRITYRITIRCGRPAAYAMSPKTREGYFTCVDQFRLDSPSPAVQSALTSAAAKARALW